jgi:hypothetical protein
MISHGYTSVQYNLRNTLFSYSGIGPVTETRGQGSRLTIKLFMRNN